MRPKHPENLRNREALADVRRGVPDRLAALFLFRSRDFSALNFTRANFHRPPGCWLFFGPQLYTHGNRRICRRSDALALFLRTEAKRREIAGKRPTLARWYQSPPGTSTPDGLAVLLRGPDALRGRGAKITPPNFWQDHAPGILCALSKLREPGQFAALRCSQAGGPVGSR